MISARAKLNNLSLTSDDELILAPRFDMVFNTEQTLVWSAVADSKGNVYLGTGHDGKIFKVDAAGKGAMLVDLSELDVLALAVDNKDVALCGHGSGRQRCTESKTARRQEFFDQRRNISGRSFFDKQGRLLVSTGDKGVIYRVTADGKGSPFYDTDETHIISMTIDREGNVIAGRRSEGIRLSDFT